MEKKTGLVSCVTPVWNGEKYIGPMLESVLGQTYPWIEMILVDDGSEDHTLEVAESYRPLFAQKGYEYQIVRTPHKNASAAINQGLLLVHGEYLIWPDSDDRLEKDSVEKRVDFLVRHPEYDSVRTLMHYFDSSGKPAEADEKIGDLERTNIFFDILEFRTFVCCGCYMLKTREFFSIYPGKQIPESQAGQNFQMLLPYMYHYKCYTIQEKLYGVCIHEDSHSRRKLTQKEEQQRFGEFERLMDEIGVICNIRNPLEKKRILCWKLQRRYLLARKYGKRLKARRIKLLLYVLGGIGQTKKIKRV